MNFRQLFQYIMAGMFLAGCESPSAPLPTRTTLAVAAAADLKFALDEAIAEFGKQHPEIEVRATYGSSGTLFAQLSNRAPFDLFLSADIEYPRRLIEQGQADADSEFAYAVGHLVVWVRKESPLDVERLGIEALQDPAVRKIAIANPQHAPYGRAAAAALQHYGIEESVREKLVLGENVAQTAQFVESGAADVGIIALSLALAPALRDKGRYWQVPLDAYPIMTQGGVILSWTKHRTDCEKLRTFLLEDAGRAILKRYGFVLPGE